jgi:hypothetical protein
MLLQIESALGRERHDRWADRTLDLDLLLYSDEIIDTPALTVPHPRMSFRRFVLEPAAEIAGSMIHPTSGWTLDQLLSHLDAGADRIAIVSPDEPARRGLAATLVERGGFKNVDPAPLDEARWPSRWTTWLALLAATDPSAAELPKLTILLDPAAGRDAAWDALAQQLGRGPALHIPAASPSIVEQEAFAAIESIWPRLGPPGNMRIQ